jgi:hypothetical protein
MTQQSAVLLIAFLAGLVVAAVLLGTARRNILPRSAMIIAALAIPIWVALVWLDVWRLHRGFFPCPRIYLWGRKKASNACLGLGDCRFPHTQFDWIHPLFCVPRASPWALQFLWQAYSRGRSILQPLRMLAGFQYRTHHS